MTGFIITRNAVIFTEVLLWKLFTDALFKFDELSRAWHWEEVDRKYALIKIRLRELAVRYYDSYAT